MRPGFGERHPAVAALLAGSVPVASAEFSWLDGAMPLRASAYCDVADLPEPLVSSVRCLVLVGEMVVVCENADGCHPWPGGRREPGETFVETACREIREETGWIVDPASVEPVGWLHLEHLKTQEPEYPYPHPDFLQLVCVGRAVEREADAWVDTDGWEQASKLVTLEAAHQVVRFDGDACAHAFLDLVEKYL